MRWLMAMAFLFCAVRGTAQVPHPKASPLSEVRQMVGLSQITVVYSRPSAKGRHIFGNQPDGTPGLVPYGRIWRVGANESTKVTVDVDMEVMGHGLSKGTYALYAFPEENEWQIAFHTNTTHWGDGRKAYDPLEDLFRIKVKPQKMGCHQETFSISFDSITHNSAQMNLIWARTKVTIPFSVDTDAVMQQRITEQLRAHPTAQTYYEAARYLQEQGQEPGRALDYLNKALELGGDTYYFHRVKSLVEADLGAFGEAIKSARKSLQLAAALGKDEFVRMNEKNIRKWKVIMEK
ncbi:MAG: DUF2911 domain-containing protein [Flavobacteriaceae bacterium]